MSLSRFKNISFKLPAIVLTMICLSNLVNSYIQFTETRHTITDIQKDKLTTLAVVRKEALVSYFKEIETDIRVSANTKSYQDALIKFTAAFKRVGSEGADATALLQKKYITDNPYKVGEKFKYRNANDGSYYSAVHSVYHPDMLQHQQNRGYYDIFLIDATGNIVSTVFKEADFATNLISGQWKDTDLGVLFRKIAANPKVGMLFSDFKKYKPSADAPASFMMYPVFDPIDKTTFIGAIAFQMPISNINNLLNKEEGLQKTGVMQIVGEDHFIRNDNRLWKEGDETAILNKKMDNESVNGALKGETGFYLIHNDKRETVFSSSTPLNFANVHWALVVEQNYDEVMEPIVTIRNQSVLLSVSIMFVMGVLSILYARSLTRPIREMSVAMGDLASGDYNRPIPATERSDEIGSMSKSLDLFKKSLIEAKEIALQQEQSKIVAERDRKEALLNLANNFDSRTKDVIASLSEASSSMQAAAEQLSKTSAQTAKASHVVATAASEADVNVQTVASATDELAASGLEISRQVSSVADRTSQATQEAASTSKTVSELSEYAQSVGDVVGAIRAIAEQTNLLALNATIEAARAGDAGKGFAVVADEVKKLAIETGEKTEEINARVEKIQVAIRETVEAVHRIINNVQQIDQAATSVSSAVEEQTAATSEIGRNVAEASNGTQQVSSTIKEVSQNAAETGDGAELVLATAQQLAEITAELKTQIVLFLNEVRQE